MDRNLGVSYQLKDLGAFHLDSFNYVINGGLEKACCDISPEYTARHIKISVSNAKLKQLQYPMNTRKHKRIVFPSEARLRLATYYAELHVQLCFQRGDDVEYCFRIFYVPVMIKSKLCHLHGCNDSDLIKVKEDINDPGGYFIVKGKERIFRHFVVIKRNYPLARIDSKWKTLRENYSEYGILIRSVKNEHLFSTNSLHLTTDGCFELRLFHNFTSYYFQVMLILKALVDKCDYLIISHVLKYCKQLQNVKLKSMLQCMHELGIHSQNDAKIFIGKKFFGVLNLPETASYIDAADLFLRKSVLIHLDGFEDKFEFLCFSLCKLHSLANNDIRPDDIDNPVYQEVLSTGQIFLLMIKHGITTYLKSVRNVIEKKDEKGTLSLKKVPLEKFCNTALSFSPLVVTMIATGNFPGKKFGLKSETGYTIALKRTNVFELAAQLTSICKFSVPYYLKDTRQYYPESWGFLCPTQTPEGENCGLYNHLASQCKIVNMSSGRIKEDVLLTYGVLPYSDPAVFCTNKEIYPVLVDGKIIGWIYSALSSKLLLALTELKSSESDLIPYHLEIIYIFKDQCLFPGFYLFSSPCRLVRKVLNVQKNREEFLGVFEQAFIQNWSSLNPKAPQYEEISPANILSLSARMIPFCEHNSAVRNIFSSVKIKQALGLPFFNFNGRSDSRTYQLTYGQSPIVSCKMNFESNFNFYPHGTNVMIAVLAYTGYDMEDALVLNKASIERGLMQNIMYKTTFYDFDELTKEYRCTSKELQFKRNDMDPFIADYLDENGFPYIGVRVKYNSPILSVCNVKTGEYYIKRYIENYESYVHSVRLTGDVPCSTKNIPKNSKKLSITFYSRKIPTVGDKFNTRHGGKGICSALMAAEDLPFSELGWTPDLIFNPNGLPSRMSIGVFFEMAAAKLKIQTCNDGKGPTYIIEPFDSKQSSKAYKKIGDALLEAGLNFYGTEKFYSGTSGLELEADVFCGSMYYLRLHHMVQEKYQVQSVGPVDERTLQPINLGRSGAVRFGEMERDAILSHGASELTRDRLLLCSDKCTAFVCSVCHSLIFPVVPPPLPELRNRNIGERETEISAFCRLCQRRSDFKVQIPYVLCYLVSELAVCGISIKFSDK